VHIKYQVPDIELRTWKVEVKPVNLPVMKIKLLGDLGKSLAMIDRRSILSVSSTLARLII
jgi:hypothetical protein